MAGSDLPLLKLVFMGTAEFGLPSFEALLASRHTMVAAYTQPARPAGRGLQARPSAIAEAAARNQVPVLTPRTLKDVIAQEEFQALGADLAIVAAYGLLLPKPVLEAPRLGCINIHGSALPRWRGASPIQHAILEGDAESGITIIQMEPTLDTGPVFALERVAIGPRMTASELHDALQRLAAQMIVPAVEAIARGERQPVPQPDVGVTYAPKIDKSAGELNWKRRALDLDRQVRALTPWPGCWTHDGEVVLRITGAEPVDGSGAPGEVLDEHLTVACGEGALRLTSLQRPGGRPLPAEAFLRGYRLPPGSQLGRPCPATP